MEDATRRVRAVITAAFWLLAADAISSAARSQTADTSSADQSTARGARTLSIEPGASISDVMATEMARDQCLNANLDCNIYSRRRLIAVPYMRDGMRIPDRTLTPPRSYLVIGIDNRRIGFGLSKTLSACVRSELRYTCHDHARPDYRTEETGQPLSEPSWLNDRSRDDLAAGTDLRASWVDLRSPGYGIACLSLDPALLIAREPNSFPSRRSFPRYLNCQVRADPRP